MKRFPEERAIGIVLAIAAAGYAFALFGLPFHGSASASAGYCTIGYDCSPTSIVLAPPTATNPVGSPHTVTATVTDAGGNQVAGVTVTFNVTSGPNAGLTGTDVTNTSGEATFTYTSTLTGTDHIVASFVDSAGQTHTSNEVTKTWIQDRTPPHCALIATIPGPPKSIQVEVQDTGSGLASIAHSETNAVTVVPPFAPGTTSPVVVTSTKIVQSQSSTLKLTVTDVAGNITICDPVVRGTLLRAHARSHRLLRFGRLHHARVRW